MLENMLLENNVADVADVMPTLIFRLSEPTNILVLTQILHITYTCTLHSILNLGQLVSTI